MSRAVLSLVFAVLLAAGCVGDPPRDNPFDPLADNFRDEGTVTGTVTRFYSPEGIGGARVHLIPLDTTGVAEHVLQAGPDGRFTAAGLSTGRYAVVAEAEGFAPAADTVEVTLGTQAQAEGLALDGLPVVTEQAVRTAYIERWWPPDPLENLIVEVTVSDPDGLGDVDRVAVSVPELGFADTLWAVPGAPARYARTFARPELGHPLSAFLGKAVRVAVTDRAGATEFAPGVQVMRIVDTFPQPLAPGREGDTTVGPTPLLTWIPLVLPYPFTYTVEIVLVPAPNQQVLVETFSGLPPTQTELQVTEPLDNGSYFWLLSVVDDFGNRSQARSAPFTVVGSPAP